MKKLIALMTLSLSLNIFAAATTPLNAIEEASHVILKYTQAGKMDPSFLTNVTTITVQSTATGFQTVSYAPSATPAEANTVTVTFDLKGRLATVNQNFISVFPQGPIFINADAATLLDLGTEAVVDHVSESAELLDVAQTASIAQISAVANGVVLRIQLTSGKIYNINMDQNGNVLSKGF